MKRSDKLAGPVVARGPNKPKPITEVRELITRKEAAAILGCHVDTLKKLERDRGGPLEIRRLHPAGRSVYYRLAEVMTIASPPNAQKASSRA